MEPAPTPKVRVHKEIANADESGKPLIISASCAVCGVGLEATPRFVKNFGNYSDYSDPKKGGGPSRKVWEKDGRANLPTSRSATSALGRVLLADPSLLLGGRLAGFWGPLRGF